MQRVNGEAADGSGEETQSKRRGTGESARLPGAGSGGSALQVPPLRPRPRPHTAPPPRPPPTPAPQPLPAAAPRRAQPPGGPPGAGPGRERPGGARGARGARGEAAPPRAGRRHGRPGRRLDPGAHGPGPPCARPRGAPGRPAPAGPCSRAGPWQAGTDLGPPGVVFAGPSGRARCYGAGAGSGPALQVEALPWLLRESCNTCRSGVESVSKSQPLRVTQSLDLFSETCMCWRRWTTCSRPCTMRA